MFWSSFGKNILGTDDPKITLESFVYSWKLLAKEETTFFFMDKQLLKPNQLSFTFASFYWEVHAQDSAEGGSDEDEFRPLVRPI